MPISLTNGSLAFVEEGVNSAIDGINRAFGEASLKPVSEKSSVALTTGVSRLPLNPGRTLVIKGALQASEDLAIDGAIEGTVDVHGHTIVIGGQGKIYGNLYADVVIVFGKVMGNIYAADHVELRRTGIVLGDLTAARVVIEDGAYFKGSIDIRRRTEVEAEGSKVMKLPPNYTIASEPPLTRYHELVDKKLENVLAPAEVEELRVIENMMDLIGSDKIPPLENHRRIINRLDDLIAELRSTLAAGSKP